MSSLRRVPVLGGRALLVIVTLVVLVALVVLFSGSLTRSTDVESRAQQAYAELEFSRQQLAETEAEAEFIKSTESFRWQARVNGFGEPGEIRFALPDNAPSPVPIVPIGPQDAAEPMAPFDAWMELLFGA